jgi:hypothetical protein
MSEEVQDQGVECSHASIGLRVEAKSLGGWELGFICDANPKEQRFKVQLDSDQDSLWHLKPSDVRRPRNKLKRVLTIFAAEARKLGHELRYDINNAAAAGIESFAKRLEAAAAQEKE